MHPVGIVVLGFVLLCFLFVLACAVGTFLSLVSLSYPPPPVRVEGRAILDTRKNLRLAWHVPGRTDAEIAKTIARHSMFYAREVPRPSWMEFKVRSVNPTRAAENLRRLLDGEL